MSTKSITKHDEIRYRYIKGSLAVSGIKMKDIAESLGVSSPAISLTIKGKIESKKIKDAIAEALKMPTDMLWPSH
jgi:lambda repressor-like predicted transcriptional regulator